MATASQPLELAWLHHEFCKFLIDINRFDLARFYAKKGIDFARKAACDEWIVNIQHLLLRIEIHQTNRNEAKEAAVAALECAKQLDIDFLVKIKSHHFTFLAAKRAQLSLIGGSKFVLHDRRRSRD